MGVAEGEQLRLISPAVPVAVGQLLHRPAESPPHRIRIGPVRSPHPAELTPPEPPRGASQETATSLTRATAYVEVSKVRSVARYSQRDRRV